MTDDPLPTPDTDSQTASAQKPSSPRWRRWGRAALVWLGLVLLAGVIQGFLFEPPLQQRLCRWEPLTPICAAVGLGRLPNEEQKRDFAEAERLATRAGWNAFRDKYPDGPLDTAALRALERCRTADEPRWRPAVMPPLPLRIDPSAFVAASAAPGQAEAQAHATARRLLCGGYDGGEYRLREVRIEGEARPCHTLNGRVACGWEGQAVCEVDVAELVEVC